jgi:hypothetical protein
VDLGSPWYNKPCVKTLLTSKQNCIPQLRIAEWDLMYDVRSAGTLIKISQKKKWGRSMKDNQWQNEKLAESRIDNV